MFINWIFVFLGPFKVLTSIDFKEHLKAIFNCPITVCTLHLGYHVNWLMSTLARFWIWLQLMSDVLELKTKGCERWSGLLISTVLQEVRANSAAFSTAFGCFLPPLLMTNKKREREQTRKQLLLDFLLLQ